MRQRFSSFIALTVLIIVAVPQAARAVTSPPPSSVCGTTVEQNLAAAEHALQSGDADSRRALACLINATANLNKRLNDYETGKSPSQEWHPRITDYPIKPGQ